jgi:hypothetical protein
MSEMIAYCGLTCSECPAFIAYKIDDDDLRARTAETWSQEFGEPFKPEDINCVGCLKASGVHIGHCAVCEIRACGMQRGVENCAYCDDYTCDKLAKFFAMVPDAQAKLESLRA